jgi:hypothetical protein
VNTFCFSRDKTTWSRPPFMYTKVILTPARTEFGTYKTACGGT